MIANAELLEQLRSLDETLLLELLELTSEDIVDAFIEKINDRETYISQKLNEED